MSRAPESTATGESAAQDAAPADAATDSAAAEAATSETPVEPPAATEATATAAETGDQPGGFFDQSADELDLIWISPIRRPGIRPQPR